ncbi:MAG: response regulator [Bacteroidia bacterium]|nr:response regulator [Bacteroidia bacterium]
MFSSNILKPGINRLVLLGYLALIILFIITAGIIAHTLRQNTEIRQTISEKIDPSINKVQEFNLLITNSKMYTTNWVYLRSNEADKQALRKLISKDYPKLKSILKDLSYYWKNPKEIDQLNKTLKDYEELISVEKQIMNELDKFEHYDDPLKKFICESAIEENVIPISAQLKDDLAILENMLNKEKMDGEEILQKSNQNLKMMILLLVALFVVVSLLFSGFFANLITKPINEIRSIVLELGKGNLQKLNDTSREDEIGEMIRAVNILTESLRKTAVFAEKIGNREYNAEFSPLSEVDILGHSLVTMRDNLERNERELTKAKDDALAAAQVKSQFLSNMSHEIRTPMNAIIGISEMLVKEQLPADVLENLNYIRNSGENLLVIINDILDFSKMEAGKILFEKIDFLPNSIFKHLDKTLSIQAKKRGLSLSVKLDESIPKVLKGDPYRLNQVLTNLVGNAVKFTENGRVEIIGKALKIWDGKLLLEIQVKDTGIGIPQNKLESVFESFTQAKLDNTRKYGGTGLGLSITKRLVEMQGGTIQVESEEGVGTTFTIQLVYEVVQNQVLENETHANLITVSEFEGLHILLVEDNKMNQIVAKQMLAKWKTMVTVANNGIEAIEILNNTEFNLVLMDLQMPEMDGYEATRLIRDPNSKVLDHDVPIIALTADAFNDTREKILEIGATDFLPKPYKPEQLFEKIASHVKINNNKAA